MQARLESLTTTPGQHFQSNACTTLLDKSKDVCGLARHIDDDAACSKGSQPFSCFESPRRATTWRCHGDPRGAAWETDCQTYDHDPDGSSHALRSLAGAQHHGQGRPAVRQPATLSTGSYR
jgi:hypothetical protein